MEVFPSAVKIIKIIKHEPGIRAKVKGKDKGKANSAFCAEAIRAC